jgi:phosphoglycolate phosphatase
VRYRGILFDKDGTLFDFERSYAPACAKVIGALAGDDSLLAKRLAQAAGFDLDGNRFSPSSIVIAGSIAELARVWQPYLCTGNVEALEKQIDALFLRYSRQSLTLFEGVPAMLRKLQNMGLILGLATNDSEAVGHAHLCLAGIENNFSFIAGYDSGYGAKPEPGMIKAFAQKFQLAADTVIMVGDSERDMVAARQAGACAIAIKSLRTDADNLFCQADFMIDHVNQLLDLELFRQQRQPQ